MPHSPPPPPPLHPYWFYTSSIAIDDPLAPLPTAQSTAKQPPRPFSLYDSSALEASYQELLEEQKSKSTGPSGSNSRAPSVRHVDSGKAKTAAVKGQPTFTESDDEPQLQLRDEIASVVGDAEGRPLARESSCTSLQRKDSSPSPLRSFFTPSSSSGVPEIPDTNAINTTPTRNPFIRSLTMSRASTIPAQPPSPSTSSRRSSIGTVKKAVVPQKEIPVGIQRLHKVLLPGFVMSPIYWRPLQDISSVVRGTWFYKDTMLPVETEIANRLEIGWEEVQAWTEEWDLELASAVEVGREGEEKVRWKLWDMSTVTAPNSRPGTSDDNDGEMTSPELVIPSTPTNSAPTALPSDIDRQPKVKPNIWDWVLFANVRDAYICRDSMLSFGNKRPLANIRKGKTVGTHVVRGFSEKEWLKIHPLRRRPGDTATARLRASKLPPSGPLRDPREKYGRNGSAATIKPAVQSSDFQAGGSVGGFQEHQEEGLGVGENAEYRGRVTDLFLVIHGIGQKLSERVESFHFTHAVNGFRRLVNQELKNENVIPLLREDVGMMVLPVNWRHNLSFDDGIDGTASGEDTTFSLDDITLPSIPAVRGLISDVMLDIPFYLSHHKQKMTKAVINEANRVYKLWCNNNPGFENYGRVHLIAHSLGSAIAMDILSKQPTHTVYERNPAPPPSSSGWGKSRRPPVKPADDHFAFDTTNIFFCGCPAGFFLLLNRSSLIPRRGRSKPGASRDADSDPTVSGDIGKYGCMAVDNVYNIMHYSDPIAYRLNPTVDVPYANTLRTSHVPTFQPPSYLTSLTSYFSPSAPPAPTRLPSNLELEDHDFGREGLAEKRLFLLNDNGQLDWYLAAGRPLESQYLNMLGAHSAYWESREFVRLCVVEAGRRPGRGASVEGMGVCKKRAFWTK